METEIATPDEDDGFDLDEYLLTHLPEYDEYVDKHLLINAVCKFL